MQQPVQTSDPTAKILALLTGIAPDIDPASVDPNQALRDQFDFDSMDALHFATAISETFGIAIAQSEYPKLASVRGAADFVRERLTK